MPKDSQIDPKEIRKLKANGQTTLADEKVDNEGRNAKKQSVKKNNFLNNK